MQLEALLPHEVESALVVVRQALHDEIAGQRFYNDAAFYCIDLWAKEVFASLAQEEQVHIQVLLLEYESLKTKGRWLDLQAARASDANVDVTQFDFGDDEPAQELFPPQWSVEQAVDRRSDDLAALAFGIQMEQAAIDLYSRTARRKRGPHGPGDLWLFGRGRDATLPRTQGPVGKPGRNDVPG